jgi:hypothetical protein
MFSRQNSSNEASSSASRRSATVTLGSTTVTPLPPRALARSFP